MRRRLIYASVTHRDVPESPVRGDALYVLDWDAERVVSVVPMGYGASGRTSSSSGVRTTGTRGLAFVDGDLWVAGSAGVVSVFRIGGPEPALVREFDVGVWLHQIKVHDGLVYAVGADDSIHVFDRNGDRVSLLYIPDLIDLAEVDALVRPPFTNHEYGADRLHLNSIGWDEAGSLHVVMLGAHAAYDVGRRRLLPFGAALMSPHDIAFWNSLTVVNSSADLSICALDSDDRVLVLRRPSTPPDIMATSLEGFTRGLAKCGAVLLCGKAPLTIAMLAPAPGGASLVHEVSFLDDSTAAIYDIAIDPADWTEP